MTKTTSEIDLEPYFNSYKKCYETFDLENLVSFFVAPLTIIHKGTIKSIPTMAEVSKNMSALFEIYKEKGLVKADYLILFTQNFDKNNILTCLEWSLYDQENNILDHFKCNYQLLNQGNGFKIVVVSNLEENVHHNALYHSL